MEKAKWEKIREAAGRLWFDLHAHVSELAREADLTGDERYWVLYAALRMVLSNVDVIAHYDPKSENLDVAKYAADTIINILTGIVKVGLTDLHLADNQLYTWLTELAWHVKDALNNPS